MASPALDAVQEKLSKVQDVDIDSSGRFKYILIKLFSKNDPAKSPSTESFKYVVRGHADCPYHGSLDIDNYSTKTVNKVSIFSLISRGYLRSVCGYVEDD